MHGEAMSGADRQSLYAKARQRDMAEVAFALKTTLARSKVERKAFIEVYRGTASGRRLRRWPWPDARCTMPRRWRSSTGCFRQMTIPDAGEPAPSRLPGPPARYTTTQPRSELH